MSGRLIDAEKLETFLQKFDDEHIARDSREIVRWVVGEIEYAIDEGHLDAQSPTPEPDEDGPGEEDGPWAEGWAERAGLSPTPGQDGLKWLPIETAPKTGIIWLACEHSMRLGFWRDGKEHECYGSVGGGWKDWALSTYEGPSDLRYAPTIWMPTPTLPPSPTSTGERE